MNTTAETTHVVTTVDHEHCLVELDADNYAEWMRGELDTVCYHEMRDRCGHVHTDPDSKNARRCLEQFQKRWDEMYPGIQGDIE